MDGEAKTIQGYHILDNTAKKNKAGGFPPQLSPKPVLFLIAVSIGYLACDIPGLKTNLAYDAVVSARGLR